MDDKAFDSSCRDKVMDAVNCGEIRTRDANLLEAWKMLYLSFSGAIQDQRKIFQTLCKDRLKRNHFQMKAVVDEDNVASSAALLLPLFASLVRRYIVYIHVPRTHVFIQLRTRTLHVYIPFQKQTPRQYKFN